MDIKIEFRPDDGPPQTLYADLPRDEVKDLEAATKDPSRAEDVVQIPARVEKNGRAKPLLFRVGRIKIRRA
ncbi:hypothetical protein [Actinomadura luteofluorescens]|uniref:hypothetical protein n=1 Tax=Actinomadura luteofluorescens TaxID=46163 RepID=UPI003D92755F